MMDWGDGRGVAASYIYHRGKGNSLFVLCAVTSGISYATLSPRQGHEAFEAYVLQYAP